MIIKSQERNGSERGSTLLQVRREEELRDKKQYTLRNTRPRRDKDKEKTKEIPEKKISNGFTSIRVPK